MILTKSLLFLLGLLFGSFLSAFTYRYPRGLGFIKGRSYCPKCKAVIPWYDNIPLLSFLLLGGYCRNCKTKISLRYPLIETAAALGFLVIGFNFVYLALFLILLSIFVIDAEHQIIPDELIFIGLVLFLIQRLNYTDILSGFLTAVVLLLIHIATKGFGMGLGDVKFALLGGALVGLRSSLIWLFLAFLTGAIVGIILIFSRKLKLKDKIAFGPFLIIAIPLTLFYGEKILEGLHIN